MNEDFRLEISESHRVSTWLVIKEHIFQSESAVSVASVSTGSSKRPLSVITTWHTTGCLLMGMAATKRGQLCHTSLCPRGTVQCFHVLFVALFLFIKHKM